MSRPNAYASENTSIVALPVRDEAIRRGTGHKTPAPIAAGERPTASDVLWAVPKLAVSNAAKFLLQAAWCCESTGEFREVTASNRRLGDWAGMSERSIRSAKKQLLAKGYVEFMHRSRGKADHTGQQTDVFRVLWAKVFEDANRILDERAAKTNRERAQHDEQWKKAGRTDKPQDALAVPLCRNQFRR